METLWDYLAVGLSEWQGNCNFNSRHLLFHFKGPNYLCESFLCKITDITFGAWLLQVHHGTQFSYFVMSRGIWALEPDGNIRDGCQLKTVVWTWDKTWLGQPCKDVWELVGGRMWGLIRGVLRSKMLEVGLVTSIRDSEGCDWRVLNWRR